jgi:hypothetical protein
MKKLGLQFFQPMESDVTDDGTAHPAMKFDDHIDYFMVRLDPDKITPLKRETQSKDYLSKPAVAVQ